MQNLSVLAETAGAGAGAGAGLSLRRKLDLIFAVLTLLVLSIFVTVEIQATRSSIREEMEASKRISTQLLSRIGEGYGRANMPQLAKFLRQTGRVRASEVTLIDEAGSLLYTSPPPTYKAGRNAPDWYTEVVAPRMAPTTIVLDGARLQVTMNPSRAVLDSWDDLKTILISQGLLLLAADLLVFWLVGRWLVPLERISGGLRQMEAGQHHIRLPSLPGREAGEMGRAFNRMAQAVEENLQVRQAGAEAQARLQAQRESSRLLNARIEDERAALARELHDELGQSLTAMRSIAMSLLHSPELQGTTGAQAARLLFDTAGTTYDAMHRMIPRLRPIQLDGMDLIDAVRDMATDLQLRHPPLHIALQVMAPLPRLPDVLEISIFRIIQEALTNVIRHAGATRATIAFSLSDGQLQIVVADDGKGSDMRVHKSGHYGVRGMQERAESLGGSVQFGASPGGGLSVQVRLPMPAAMVGAVPDAVAASVPGAAAIHCNDALQR